MDDKASITRADVIRMLNEDHSLAREKGQIGTAIGAAELLGKELGMFTDRVEILPPVDDDAGAACRGGGKAGLPVEGAA